MRTERFCCRHTANNNSVGMTTTNSQAEFKKMLKEKTDDKLTYINVYILFKETSKLKKNSPEKEI